MTGQFSFFDDQTNEAAAKLLVGFRYNPALIDPGEEKELIPKIRNLPFKEFDFHGYKGKRRVVSFGWRYEFSGGGKLRKADDIPEFLLPLQSQAAAFARTEPEQLQHVLVTEYGPGAGIGWHRDKAVFGNVVGVSLLAPCVLRFRRKVKETRTSLTNANWERANVLAQPRSAYFLSGPARSEWEHSILRVDELRYSITFRNMLENQ